MLISTNGTIYKTKINQAITQIDLIKELDPKLISEDQVIDTPVVADLDKVNITKAGEYPVTLTATDPNGKVISKEITLIVEDEEVQTNKSIAPVGVGGTQAPKRVDELANDKKEALQTQDTKANKNNIPDNLKNGSVPLPKKRNNVSSKQKNSSNNFWVKYGKWIIGGAIILVLVLLYFRGSAQQNENLNKQANQQAQINKNQNQINQLKKQNQALQNQANNLKQAMTDYQNNQNKVALQTRLQQIQDQIGELRSQQSAPIQHELDLLNQKAEQVKKDPSQAANTISSLNSDPNLQGNAQNTLQKTWENILSFFGI